MDILSFILGMSVVVVIVVSIVAVIAFVKVKKHEKEIEQVHQIYWGEIERVRKEMTDMQRDIFSSMDSRLDKLESKLISRKA